MVRALVGRVRVCGPRGCATAIAMLDTGAEISGVSARLARRLGLPRAGEVRVHTANGPMRRPAVWIEAALGWCQPVRFAALIQRPILARVDMLIGLNYLARAGVEVDVAGRRVRCRQPDQPRSRRR